MIVEPKDRGGMTVAVRDPLVQPMIARPGRADEELALHVSSVSVPGILRGVSLTVERGQIVALIGPNGAGKSTLLRACAHLHPPSAGTIHLYGRPLRSYSARERARQMGFLPQQTSIDVPYSVRDIVELGAYARVTPFTPEAAECILAEVGLTRLAERDVRTLSGGERQRALIGKVLAQDARLLLLDEPVSGLDVAYQWDIMQICKSFVADRQRSVLVTLHDLELVLQYADQAVLIHDGEVCAAGHPHDVLTSAELTRVFGARGHTFRDPHTDAWRLSLERIRG